MPLPTPNGGETEDSFMGRCMSTLKTEFPDQKQRLAVCFSQFRKKKKMRNGKRILKLDGLFQVRKLSDADHVIAGYASPAIIDRENEHFPLPTLKAWWEKFVASDYQIVTVDHDEIPVGTVLQEYVDTHGVTHRSGVDERGLYVVTKLRTDSRAAADVWRQIERWGGKGSYSISASVFSDPIPRFSDDGKLYYEYPPDSGELNAITIGREGEGANPEAIFQIVKLKKTPVIKAKRVLKLKHERKRLRWR